MKSWGGSLRGRLFCQSEQLGWFLFSVQDMAGFHVILWSRLCLHPLLVLVPKLFAANPATAVIASCRCGPTTRKNSPRNSVFRFARPAFYNAPESIAMRERMAGRTHCQISPRLVCTVTRAGIGSRTRHLTRPICSEWGGKWRAANGMAAGSLRATSLQRKNRPCDRKFGLL
jgi:hypothetical protein